MIVRLLVATVVFLLALDGGTYSLVSRHSLAIAVWWTVLVGLALGFWPRQRPTARTLAVGGLLAGFVGWTALSIGWAASTEKAFLEFDRAALYLGVFVLVALAAERQDAPTWCDGLAIGLVGVTAAALGSRLFPTLTPDSDLVHFLPDAAGRLTFPVEYWNGLGILVALGIPLLLRAAVVARAGVIRGVALAPVPAMAAAIYLTSSRGATAAALLGALVFLAATERRWAAAGAIALSLTGSAAALAVLQAMPDLANAIGDAPEEQGPLAAALILAACAWTGLCYGVGARFLVREPPRALGVAFAAVVFVAAIVGVAVSDPAERFEAFKRTPAKSAPPREDFVGTHLLSGGGGGRWQFWSTALEEFREHPIRGGGAGSYEAWWAEHGSFSYFVRDAHSLYLETLAELGLVGLTLLAGAFALGIALGARALGNTRQRSTVAALLAAFLAYALAAGFDWMWELTIVSVVGVACLALVAIAASRTAPESELRRPTRALAALAGLLVCVEALPLLSQFEIHASQAAVRRGDPSAAVAHLDSAHKLQPWAASPYLQLALVEEETGRLAHARRAIGEALERDPSDWRAWLIAARIDTKAGRISAARRSLRRSIELNPRSPFFR